MQIKSSDKYTGIYRYTFLIHKDLLWILLTGQVYWQWFATFFSSLRKSLFFLYFWRILSSLFITFKYFIALSCCLHVFWQEVHCISYTCSSFVWPFSDIFLSVLICCQLHMLYLGVLFLYCLVFSELPGSVVLYMSLILENYWSLFIQLFLLIHSI